MITAVRYSRILLLLVLAITLVFPLLYSLSIHFSMNKAEALSDKTPLRKVTKSKILLLPLKRTNGAEKIPEALMSDNFAGVTTEFRAIRIPPYGHKKNEVQRASYPSLQVEDESKQEKQKNYELPMLPITASIALTFGALAARRLTKRKYLELSCFESDNIESELAYDIAYTITPSEVGYGSFATPWTGDLEKFDV